MADIVQNKTMNELIAKVFGDSEAPGPGSEQSSPPGGIETVPESAETAGSDQDRVVNGLMSKIFGADEASGSGSGEKAPGPAETKRQDE